MNKKAVAPLIAILLFVIMGFVLIKSGLISTGSLVATPEVVKQELWNGIPVTIKTTYLGSITSASGVQDVCGTNDPGRATILNSYVISGPILLKSSSAGDNVGCRGNYISAEFEAGPGEIKVTDSYIMGYSQGSDATSEVFIYVNSLKKGGSSATVCRQDRAGGDCAGSYVSLTKISNINLDKKSKIKIVVVTSAPSTGSATIDTKIDYTPKIEPVIETSNPENPTNTNTNSNSDDDELTTEKGFIQKVIDWIVGFFNSIFK